MAQRRPTKRFKTTDTRSNRVSPVVVIDDDDLSWALLGDLEDYIALVDDLDIDKAIDNNDIAIDNTNIRNNNNNSNTPPAVGTTVIHNINEILFSLASSTTKAQAIKAMAKLSDSMLTGTNAQQVFDLQGISTIVYGMLRYTSSERMLMHGLRALVNMTKVLFNDKVGETLQRLDFLDKIPPSLSNITETKVVSSNWVGLFGNLAANAKNCESLLQLGSEGIVKFIVHAMTTYPNDVYVTNAACMHLDKMSRIPEMKERLLKEGVVIRMAVAFQTFSNLDEELEFNEDDRPCVRRIIKHSKRALGRLIS
jgi:hypothetical protein